MSVVLSWKGVLSWVARSTPVLLVSGCATGLPSVSAEAIGASDGSLFAEIQVRRGAEVYGANCAVCHGAALTGGGGAPPLQGPDFLFGWSAKTTVDLVEYVASMMPPGQGHSLTQEEYEDLSAYILSANGFSAGQTPLGSARQTPIGHPPEASN